MTTSTYEMIRAIPAKGFDWAGFNSALRSKVVAAGAAMPDTMATWEAAKGMRATRTAAMEMACFYVDKISKRQFCQAAAGETAAWDSFEGGHNEVWNDNDAIETATREVAQLIESSREPAG